MKAGWNSDPDPLVALAAGDPEPFEAFVQVAAGVLMGFFARQGADSHEAEDLSQQTLVRLYEHAPHYRPQQRFDAFVFRVARNALVDMRRRRKGWSSLEGEAGEGRARADERAAAPGAAAEVEDEAQKILRGVASLSPNHREVFELAVVQALPYAEVGSVLDIPIGTVKSRMHHAVQRLRAWMEDSPSRKGARSEVRP